MKKSVLTVLLAIMLLMSACGTATEAAPPTPTPAPETTAAVDVQPTPTAEEESVPAPELEDELEKLMMAIESVGAEIEAELQEALTQREMSEKAGELYEHWDAALNHFWSELEKVMPEDEFSLLLDEQLAWIAEKEETVAETGRMFEGGTAYSMAMSLKAAEITETRVYELYELLRQYNSK